MNRDDIFKDSVGRIWRCHSTQAKEWGGKPTGGYLTQLVELEPYTPKLVWDDDLETKGLIKLT